MPDILQDIHYFLDCGSLLRRLPWTTGSTFDEICQSFINYLLSNYGATENITVAFDGDNWLPNTKDSTNIR